MLLVGAATADVGHRRVDVGVGRIGIGLEQRCRRHDHAALAVAALGHVEVEPGLLDRVQLVAVGDAFDCRDLAAPTEFIGTWQERVGHAVDVHGAGAALGDAAAVLRAGHAERVAQHPEQRGVGFDVYVVSLSVDGKPLDAALADRDHIYGVLRGSAINAGGRTHGYTVPNPRAQGDLIVRALADAGVDRAHVSYVEAHGTGTDLGDPIEIAGLTRALSAAGERPVCALGSVKSNIGHCESAAGVVGLIKVLMQMRHRCLVPSLHCETPNPKIDFAATPFVLQRSCAPWGRPRVWRDGSEREVPRIAAISSFGAGGANAHVIVEELESTAPVEGTIASTPCAVLLSARTADRLVASAQRLLAALESGRLEVPLADMAYSLQVGREALDERWGTLVDCNDTLVERLRALIEGRDGEPDTFRGSPGRKKSALALFADDQDLAEAIQKWIARGKLAQLVESWTAGLPVNWSALHAGATRRRVSLPTYPFHGERYWVNPLPTYADTSPASAKTFWLRRETDAHGRLRFGAQLSGDKPFLRDHVVHGLRILPGVLSLELARDALTSLHALSDGETVRIVDLVWLRPIVLQADEQTLALTLELKQRGDKQYAFDLTRIRNGASEHCVQGTLVCVHQANSQPIDLEALRQRLGNQSVAVESLYAAFAAAGIEYGPAHQGLASAITGEGEVFAELRLPSSVQDTAPDFALHPSLLDAALQASALAFHEKADRAASEPRLPFAVAQVDVLRAVPAQAFAWIRPSAEQDGVERLDIDVCDATGRVCCRLLGVLLRASATTDARLPLATDGLHLPTEAIPVLASGAALNMQPALPVIRPTQILPHAAALSAQQIEDYVRTTIRECVSGALRMPAARIDNECSFSDYGVDSILAVSLINELNKQFGITLNTTVIFDHNTVDRFTAFILLRHDEAIRRLLQPPVAPAQERVAIATSVEPARRVPQATQQRVIPFSKGAARVSEASVASVDPSDSYLRVLIERPSAIDELSLVRSPVPALGDHDVMICVRSYSLNFSDLLLVRGLYPSMPEYPFTPGAEVSGVVVDVGARVRRLRRGDEVFAGGGSQFGGFANLLVCHEGRAFVKPTALDFDAMCALPTVALTMIEAFEKIDLQRGERILIQTATGGTGLIAVQLAQHSGAEVFATAGAQHKLDYLQSLGVAHRINYLESDFAQEIQRLTGGRGVDVVINTLAGDAIQKGLSCLAEGGRYVEIAMTALKSARRIDLSVLSSNQSFYSIDLGRLGQRRPERLQRHVDEMLRLAQAGVIRPTVSRVFDFTQFREALHYLEDRRNIGKVVVRVDEGQQYRRPARALSVASIGMASREPLAVIGLSGRFAGSETAADLWQHLAAGEDLIEEVSRWDLSEHYAHFGQQRRCHYGSFLSDIDRFDAQFFRISGQEADYMDPQQRLFLEEAWKALEDAGYVGDEDTPRYCGVYVGCGPGDYIRLFGDDAPAQAFWGNAGSVIPARIAYFLDLQGPAIAIDTACSSSLVAMHLACQALWSGEISMALAGGVYLHATPDFYVASNRADMLSARGRCHTFDSRADGFVPGEAVAAIVLKRLSEALSDGDHIYGLVRGSAINQDGTTNGITAPSARSQEALERAVYDSFGIDPRQIQLVEAHGTGTILGDPIEIEALTRAFRAYTSETQFCAIGSVKSNLGHTATAAGITGVIKALLALHHRQLPPTLNFEAPNPNIDFATSPFFVNTIGCATGWQALAQPMASAACAWRRSAHSVSVEPTHTLCWRKVLT